MSCVCAMAADWVPACRCASRRSRKGRYLQPADPLPPALSRTGRNSRYLSCILAGRCWCAAVIAVDAAGSDSRPVALTSRRFRAAPTARQVAAAQGRAACLPTLAHARVGLHGSSVRMPTIATCCIYSTKRTYHPASAGGRHSTGSRRRDPDMLYFMAGRCCSARRGRAVAVPVNS